MGSALKWTEQFGFSDAPAAERRATTENLFAALINGDISEATYLDWAQSRFELPAVRSDYFSIPADQLFWDRMKDVHPWKQHLFPIAQWDGCILIACVEPPANFHIHEPHRFVLAAATDLRSLWMRFNPEWKEVSVESIRADEPTTIPIFDNVTNGAVLDFTTMEFETASPTASAKSDAALEVPDGFAAPNSDVAELTELPDGFGPDTTVPNTDVSQITELVSVKAAEPVLTAAVIPSSPPVTPERIPVQPPVVEPVTAPAPANIQEPTPIRAPDAKPLALSSDIDELAANTLGLMARGFDGAMLFIKTESGLTPWKFTAPFKARSDFGALRLDTPSLFRIVSKTQLPYHGAISPAPENDRFFATFLDGQPPASITVVPVVLNNECTALLLGISKEPKHFRHVLPGVETIARQFGEFQSKLQGARAAA